MTPEIVSTLEPLARLLLLMLIVSTTANALLCVAIAGFAQTQRDHLEATLSALQEHAEEEAARRIA